MKKRVRLAIAAMLLILGIASVPQFQTVAATKPQVLISSYSIDDDIKFGKETSLHLNITNESGRTGVKGVLITYVSENNSIVPAQGKSNQVYIASIDAGETASIDVPVVFNNSGEFYGQASFTIEYSVENQAPFTNSSYILFPFTESGALEIKNVNVANRATARAKSLVGVNYSNISESSIRGVKLVVSGDIVGDKVETKVGDVAAQRNGYFETYVVYKHEGANKVKVSLLYEDEDGNSFVSNGGEYTVNVSPEGADENEDMQESGQIGANNSADDVIQQHNSTVIIIGLAAVVAAILVIILIVQMVRKRKM